MCDNLQQLPDAVLQETGRAKAHHDRAHKGEYCDTVLYGLQYQRVHVCMRHASMTNTGYRTYG